MQPKERLNTPACQLLSSFRLGRGIAGLSFRAAIVPSFAMFLAGPLFARKKIDVIVTENSDRITGEIKGLDAGVLRVELDYVDGTISLQWLKVARVESRQLFLVQTQDGAVYSGAIGTSESSANQPVEFQITKEPAIKVPIERVPALSDPGQVYYSTNASYYLKFFRDFTWTASFYGNWETRPPPHFMGSDYGYSSSLGWTFHK